MRVAVVLGGYGTFGRLVCASLSKHADVRLFVAGRNGHAAEALCRTLGPGVAEPAVLDCTSPDFATRLASLSPAVVVDAVGPFQARNYSAARACIEIGSHYLDLADGREYVAGIASLDEPARSRDVLVTSGVSTCPALSTAVADEISRDLASIESFDVGIAPGHRSPRGLATTRAVLGYCGKPIPTFSGGQLASTFGWSGLKRHAYPHPVGNRWLAQVDLPEMALWPRRYPSMRRLTAQASLEIPVLHLGLALLSRLVRAGVIPSLEPHAATMLRVSNWFEPFGRPVGAMHVRVVGRTNASRTIQRTWSIVAERGDGPQIPAMPAAALAKKLLGVSGYASVGARGAMPCMGLLSLAEILAELSGFAIRVEMAEVLDDGADSG